MSYNKIEGGQVLLGSNVSCKIVGIGNIKFQMFDGSVKILSNEKHFLGLKRNLISIGMLDESSMSCKTENVICIFVKVLL